MSWLDQAPDIENPDNAAALLVDLKKQLEKVHNEIEESKLYLKDLKKGNNDILNGKLSEVTARLAEAEEFRSKASEAKQAAEAETVGLNARWDELAKEVASITELREKFSEQVKLSAQELDAREEAVKVAEQKQKALSESYLLDVAALNFANTSLEENKKDLTRRESELNVHKNDINEKISENNEILASIRKEAAELRLTKESNDKASSEAVAERTRVEAILNETISKLSAIEKANEAALNLKIENKKILMQTEQRIKVAMKQEEDATTRVAELKTLKEEVTK